MNIENDCTPFSIWSISHKFVSSLKKIGLVKGYLKQNAELSGSPLPYLALIWNERTIENS
jgi:uncharacterized protein (UPF0128 family)